MRLVVAFANGSDMINEIGFFRFDDLHYVLFCNEIVLNHIEGIDRYITLSLNRNLFSFK